MYITNTEFYLLITGLINVRYPIANAFLESIFIMF